MDPLREHYDNIKLHTQEFDRKVLHAFTCESDVATAAANTYMYKQAIKLLQNAKFYDLDFRSLNETDKCLVWLTCELNSIVYSKYQTHDTSLIEELKQLVDFINEFKIQLDNVRLEILTAYKKHLPPNFVFVSYNIIVQNTYEHINSLYTVVNNINNEPESTDNIDSLKSLLNKYTGPVYVSPYLWIE